MKGLEIKLTGSLEHSGLPEHIKRRRIKIAGRLAGNFVGTGSRMIRLPLKIPFVKYQSAEIGLDTTYLGYPHVHLKETRGVLYMQKRLLGYQFN